MTPNKTPQSEPDPTSSQAEPKKSLLVRLLKQRFLLVALVVLVFFAGLFGWRYLHSGTTTAHKVTTSSNHSTPALTHTTPPPTPLPKTPPPPVEKEHEVKKEPAPALPKTPPPEEAPGHAAPPTHVVKPKQPEIPGVTFTRDLIRIIDEQVNKPLFGWRPSSIIFGKLGLTDNVNNEQIGVLQVARRSVVALNENLTRFSNTEAYNSRVNEAMNYLMVSVDKFWFPSAPGKYREAMTDLKWYIHDLKLGKAKFYTRVNSLIAVLQDYNDLLGSCYNNLVKDTEANGKPVSWFETDNYFYYSKGVALGVYQMLQSLKIDFKPELDRKNAHNMLDKAIRPLKKASKLNPWLVTNASKDGFLANHRADMSTYIGQAQNVLRSLERQLATN
jgi:hypothetical protein